MQLGMNWSTTDVAESLSERPRIAILSKKSLADHPYDQWLGDEVEVALFAESSESTERYLKGSPLRHSTLLVDDWKRSRAVDLAVMREHSDRPFARIVALSECDIVRVAQLRERLGIPGQSLLSANSFRNKLAMKEVAGRAGLSAPEFRAIDSPQALLDFAAQHGGHIVVKPIDGAGSVGVRELRSEDEAASWVAKTSFLSDEPTRLLAEEWISAPMLSVDGLMQDGAVCTAMVGRYTRTCLDSLTELEPHGILLVDAGSPIESAARSFVERLVKALPHCPDLMSFHCELFDDPHRGLMLCEIACRTGGGCLSYIAEKALGVNPELASVRGQAGLPVTIPRAAPAPGRVWGDIMVPRSERHLSTADRPPPRLVEQLVFRSPPASTVSSRATKVSDAAVEAVYSAPDHERLCEAYDIVQQWITESMKIPLR